MAFGAPSETFNEGGVTWQFTTLSLCGSDAARPFHCETARLSPRSAEAIRGQFGLNPPETQTE